MASSLCNLISHLEKITRSVVMWFTKMILPKLEIVSFFSFSLSSAILPKERPSRWCWCNMEITLYQRSEARFNDREQLALVIEFLHVSIFTLQYRRLRRGSCYAIDVSFTRFAFPLSCEFEWNSPKWNSVIFYVWEIRRIFCVGYFGIGGTCNGDFNYCKNSYRHKNISIFYKLV